MLPLLSYICIPKSLNAQVYSFVGNACFVQGKPFHIHFHVCHTIHHACMPCPRIHHNSPAVHAWSVALQTEVGVYILSLPLQLSTHSPIRGYTLCRRLQLHASTKSATADSPASRYFCAKGSLTESQSPSPAATLFSRWSASSMAIWLGLRAAATPGGRPSLLIELCKSGIPWSQAKTGRQKEPTEMQGNGQACNEIHLHVQGFLDCREVPSQLSQRSHFLEAFGQRPPGEAQSYACLRCRRSL